MTTRHENEGHFWIVPRSYPDGEVVKRTALVEAVALAVASGRPCDVHSDAGTVVWAWESGPSSYTTWADRQLAEEIFRRSLPYTPDEALGLGRQRMIEMLQERDRFQEMANMTPLYGHTSPETAYVVDDYPYGFRARTQIRYWIEKHPKRGFRFVSQTLNPKTGRWNKPKASTYSTFAGEMYLDDQGHVQWRGVTEYSDHADVERFIADFPGADLSLLAPFARAKAKWYERVVATNAAGSSGWLINGEPTPLTESDIAENRAALEAWRRIVGTTTERIGK